MADDFFLQTITRLDYWAHTRKSHDPESLLAHSTLTMDYYGQYCRQKGLDSIIKNIIGACDCDVEETAVIYGFFYDAVYWHDIGKINPEYQARILENKKNFIADVQRSSHHALLSAYIYLCEHLQQVLLEQDAMKRRRYTYFLYSFSYCIARHHGELKNVQEFSEKLQNCLEAQYSYAGNLDLTRNSIYTTDTSLTKLTKLINDKPAFYILGKMLFAVITACDFCATNEYMTGVKTELAIIKDAGVLREKYQAGDLYGLIAKYRQTGTADSINRLRCQLFCETEECLCHNPQSSIYYLEAPTGSGKTNMSINLALTMLGEDCRLNNIFYIFPFNTLIEQTADVLGEYFKYGEELQVINSLAPIYIKEEDANKPERYEQAYLDRNFDNYPIVLTSHINFFAALFGVGREKSFPLLKLCHSVVIIDEIQSYRNSIWRHIITFLSRYAKLLHIKIIIMSATLPKLDMLLDYSEIGCEITTLVRNPQQYYQNPLFKQRVKLDFSLLAYEKIDFDLLCTKVLQNKDRKVLIEFISKVTARKFFNLLQNRDKKILCVEITGDDNSKSRQASLEMINRSSAIIVVATQVIEAGLDIDLDIGFKDISLPDAEEQFLGRINRSCLRTECVAYFFNYDDAGKIYHKDERVPYSIKRPEIAAKLADKDFNGIYDGILQDLKSDSERLDINNIHLFYEDCLKLQYGRIEEHMRLLDFTGQIFLAYEFDNDGETIDGHEIWEQYKQLCGSKDIGYAEKKCRIADLALKMSYFTYNLYSYEQKNLHYDDLFAGYYYIGNGEKFICNGKFDREAFNKQQGGLFL